MVEKMGTTTRRGWWKIVVGGFLFLIVALPTLLAGVLPMPSPTHTDLGNRLQPPFTHGHLLGTDQLGRDLLSRLIWGGRVSLTIGILAVIIAGAVGTALGVLAGYSGGWFDAVVSRLIEAQLSLPLLMLLLLMIAVFGSSIPVIVVVLAVAQWPESARLARSLTMVEREKLYVTAARATGTPPLRLLVQHVLPNIASRVLVVVLLLLSTSALLESALSYLGLGVERPNPTWGRIIADGQQYISRAWWLVVIPGISISVMVLGVNLLGDGLRQRLTGERD